MTFRVVPCVQRGGCTRHDVSGGKKACLGSSEKEKGYPLLKQRKEGRGGAPEGNS